MPRRCPTTCSIRAPARRCSSAYPAQDYDRILERAATSGVGGIGIRVLAGGAMSGSETRGALGLPSVEPIGPGGT